MRKNTDACAKKGYQACAPYPVGIGMPLDEHDHFHPYLQKERY